MKKVSRKAKRRMGLLTCLLIAVIVLLGTSFFSNWSSIMKNKREVQALNEKYNEYLKIHGFHDIPIAYRTNLNGQCNINYANDTFKFIKNNVPSIVIIGDFTKFFDFLDHQYLKKQSL